MAEYLQSCKDLNTWGLDNCLEHLSTIELALKKLEEALQTHAFHKTLGSNGRMYPVWTNNPIEHPLPSADYKKDTLKISLSVSFRLRKSPYLAHKLLEIANTLPLWIRSRWRVLT